MRKMILFGLLMVSSSAYAYVTDPADMGRDIDTMIYFAGLAVQDHAVKEVGMHPGSVNIKYSYSKDLFRATDSQTGCSFMAKATISYRRLSTGHYWRVREVGGNNCQHHPMPH